MIYIKDLLTVDLCCCHFLTLVPGEQGLIQGLIQSMKQSAFQTRIWRKVRLIRG